MGTSRSKQKMLNIGDRLLIPKETFKTAHYAYIAGDHAIVVTYVDGTKQNVIFDTRSDAFAAIRKIV